MTRRKNIEAPKLPSTGGRSAIDWGILFDLWVIGQTPKRDFLLKYGLSTTSGQVRKMTKHWTQDAKKAELEVARIRLDQRAADEKAKGTAREPRGIWEFVQQCRQGQAGEDWRTAQAVRSHVKMLLQQGLEQTADGPRTLMSARELTNIAEALEKVQRIQRLALGMSTDNIGVADSSGDSNVEDVGDGSCPIFLVEVNDAGKFKRARPRQVR